MDIPEVFGRTPAVVEDEVTREMERLRVLAAKKKSQGVRVKTSEEVFAKLHANTLADPTQETLKAVLDERDLYTCHWNQTHGSSSAARLEGRTMGIEKLVECKK